MARTKKYVYLFSEGNAEMKNLLGGKGANLAQMTVLGLPVPQGFTVTTEACNKFYDDGRKLAPEVLDQIMKAVAKLEKISGKKFNDPKNPLLVSVRSGARASMPGMMDTVLNLGLNDKVMETMVKLTGNRRFVLDSYRRFIQMFGDVVKGISRKLFEAEMDKVKAAKGVKLDTDLDADDLEKVVALYKDLYKKQMKKPFPQDPTQQLIESIEAVFGSWNNERAIVYRRMNDIPGDWGTAVNIQMMVFGNMGDDSGTGVAFTRNPATGENKVFGEYLMNAQGEDVVAGIRTPLSIDKLESQNPKVFKQFLQICKTLEGFYKDMEDMEFTIERGTLYMLQTRNGKRTAPAALKIAIDMVKEKLLTQEEALKKIDPKSLEGLLHPTFIASRLKEAKVIAKGLAASPGAGCGVIALTPAQAIRYKSKKLPAILVRSETSPEDIEGMACAVGILTATGGMTSHAAVVARGMGTACVAGCSDIQINTAKHQITVNGITYREGEYISIDGTTGNIYGESIPTEEPKLTGNLATIMKWAEPYVGVEVRANADTPHDTQKAMELGATGVGLCRTEHMFFDPVRISTVRQMIIAPDQAARERALKKLLPMQRDDFLKMFKALQGKPCTIRYIDPPLHEFLPHSNNEIRTLAQEMGRPYEDVNAVVEGLREFNPMMGFRGCRLGVVYPELIKMQTTAAIEAAITCIKKHKFTPIVELMIPLVGIQKELIFIRDLITSTAEAIIKEAKVTLKYHVGTMIEVPRATVIADKIAEHADFFSFGTNDLTQMTFGFSRDDSAKFLRAYYENHILESDPFVRLDETGVGELMKNAIKAARKVKPKLECGICGEHGGDPASIHFAHRIGINYVSCSPYRVPIAKLASAQATLNEGKSHISSNA